eukprot:TRINITY_DN1997_c0_g1_i4.p2 TRINITY_DN1997_c0_g1~~TRINITY_DN1997_c0_g1_i4.p2  ORF type:complete len:217 (+),score=40.77 TRINITY_DN1997_c0_g1_i4:108-758(+)
MDLFNLFSERQLVGGALDFLTEVLREANTAALESGAAGLVEVSGSPLREVMRWDLTGHLNFFLANHEAIAKSLNVKSRLLRTYLFELKHARNEWAHQTSFRLDDVQRVYDTTLRVLDELEVRADSEIYTKVRAIRNELVLRLAHEISEGKSPERKMPSAALSSFLPAPREEPRQDYIGPSLQGFRPGRDEQRPSDDRINEEELLNPYRKDDFGKFD